MSLLNTPARYGALSIAMHWLMLLLIAAVYATVELHEAFPKGGAVRDGLVTWHNMLGLTVFVLVWTRLAIRAWGATPLITPPPVAWQARVAHWVHIALYAVMIIAPLLGWLVLSARGKPIPFFGFELPALMGPNKALGRTVKEVHEFVATTGYFLIGAHALAALFHHYVMRDNTLTRMLPRRHSPSALARSGDKLVASVDSPRAHP